MKKTVGEISQNYFWFWLRNFWDAFFDIKLRSKAFWEVPKKLKI